MSKKRSKFSKGTLKEMMNINSWRWQDLDLQSRMNVVRDLEKIANKRIRALRKEGLSVHSSALRQRHGMEFGGNMNYDASRISKGHKARTEKTLYKKFRDLKDFLNMPSSKVGNVKKTLKKVAGDFSSAKELQNASIAQQRKFWEAYDRLKADYPELLRNEKYLARRQMLFDIMVKRTKNGLRFSSVEKAVAEMVKIMNKQYEEKSRKLQEEETPLKWLDEFAENPKSEKISPFDDLD